MIHILSLFPENLKQPLTKALERVFAREICLRAGKPLTVVADKIYYVNKDGICDVQNSIRVNDADIKNMCRIIFKTSFYSVTDELKEGYITAQGGHRIGICGKAVLENGKISTVKYINSLNIRIAREVIGCADSVMESIVTNKVNSTLIISPPGCGKTTILRDIARQLSQKYKVAICDERSEIAACFNGIAQNDVGINTDVLDACPKSEGIPMLVRAMSPRVIVADEIGTEADVEAVFNAINSGVSVVCSIHGSTLSEVRKKTYAGRLFDKNVFERVIILQKPGEIGKILCL